MRVTVLGGTEFVGRRLVELLVERGDDVLVVHRGRTEPDGWVDCEHLHTDRAEFAAAAARVATFRSDAVVDSCAMTRADVDAVVPHLPDVASVARRTSSSSRSPTTGSPTTCGSRRPGGITC